MPLFTQHRKVIYDRDGQSLLPGDYDVGEVVQGFSNPAGKANRQPLSFKVTRSASGKVHFTRKGVFG